MSNINIDAQKKMQEELKRYLNKEYSCKNYATSMKEIATWLQEKAK
jgi:hypothetical protein